MTTQNVAFKLPIVHNFLMDLFGDDWPDVWVTAVPGDPNDRANATYWRGGRAGNLALDFEDTANLYYSVSVVKSGRRVAAEFGRAPIIVIDDVGTKVHAPDVEALLGSPRWVVQTSPQSQQWAYRLGSPIEDPRIFERIMKALAAKGLTDPGTIDAVRAMRLPAGINGKAKYGSPSPKVTGRHWPRVPDLDFVDLCLALGLDPIETLDPDNYPSLPASSKVGGTADMAKPDTILRALMDLGRVLGSGREQGVLDIECPFSNEHTAREDSGTAYFGGGAFKCHHGHCQGRTNWDFKARVRELYEEKNGSGAMAGLAFSCDPIDDDVVEAMKKTADAKERAGQDDEKALLAEMGRRYALVEGEKSILDLRGSDTTSIARVAREAFTLTNDARRRVGKGRSEVGLGTYCLKTPGVLRVFDRIDMIDPPGSELGGVLNIWRGFDVAPKSGKWDRIKDLIESTVASGDQALANFIFDWIARGLQSPLERAGTAVCLVGSQGTGKSTVGEILRRIYGLRYSLHASADNDLVGQFNDRLENRLLFVGDEATFGNDPKIKGKIKSLITEAALRIEGKYQSAREVRNRLKIVLTSNELAALPIEPGDRRSTIVRVSDDRKGDTAYWRDLYDHLDEEIPAFVHDMLARDISGFNHRKPHATSAKADMAEATATPFTSFLLGAIDDGIAPGADWMSGATGAAEDWDSGPVKVRAADLFSEFESWARRRHIRHIPARSVLGQELKALIPGATALKPRINGRQERVVVLPPREDCRRAIRKALGAGDDG